MQTEVLDEKINPDDLLAQITRIDEKLSDGCSKDDKVENEVQVVQPTTSSNDDEDQQKEVLLTKINELRENISATKCSNCGSSEVTEEGQRTEPVFDPSGESNQAEEDVRSYKCSECNETWVISRKVKEDKKKRRRKVGILT